MDALRQPRVAIIIVISLLLAGLLANRYLVDSETRAARDAFGGHVVHIPGPDLNVRDYGPVSDRTVMLLPGYASSMQWWDNVIPGLRAAGHRVITFDLVGQGGSDSPDNSDTYGAFGQSTAMIGVLRALGVRYAVLVGHSMGKHPAVAFAERARDLVERIAAVDTYADIGYVERPTMAQLSACQ